ncbi:MAG: hypothetical protein KDB02_01000 [Acidimicrobiales bacterium]|nr:hypothetical protein [Acidimicrobiales bacterium]
MAKRSDAARQKRARQNRAQRQALEARTSGEAVKRPSRVAPSTAERLKTTPRESTRAGSMDPAEAPAPGEKKPKPRRERPPRPGDRPVDIATLQGSWFSKVTKVPGGMQVLMAVGMTIVVTGLLAFMDTYPSEADVRAKVKNAKPTRTIFEALGVTKALLILLIPLVIVGIAAVFSLHKQRRRIWMGAAIMLGAFFAFGMLQYVFPMGFLLYATMRASRIEGPNEPLFGRRAKADSTAEGDGVDGAEAAATADEADSTASNAG